MTEKNNTESVQPPPAPASVTRDFIFQASDYVRQRMSVGASTQEILTRLASVGEMVSGPGSTVSILVLDDEGLLRNGASPNLPADYLRAIDRLKPHPHLGTCAAAAATGCVVITPDFLADDKWSELRHLPLALGYVGAWSMPIKSEEGTVLGTFGTYFRDRRTPTEEERKDVEHLVAAAALVLGSSCAQPAWTGRRACSGNANRQRQ